MKMLMSEFRDFLKEYKVIGLAIGVIIGLAANNLVKSLVDNIVMPILTPFIPNGAWQTAVWHLGPFAVGWGPFLAALINFLIIAWVVFLTAKYVLREQTVSKK